MRGITNHLTPENEPQKFLFALFSQKYEDQYILVWVKNRPPGKGGLSYWFNTWAAAGDFATIVTEQDCYAGLGLSPQAYSEKERVKAAEVAAIPGVWVDIDIAGPGHKKDNLPPDLAAAVAILESLELTPSLVIHTGGGLQAYWLFPALWQLDDTTRPAAARLVQRWTAWVRRQAGQYAIDGTQDLSRVFRIPGTFNCKEEEKRPVTILEQREARYSPEVLENFLDEQNIFLAPAPVTQPGAGGWADIAGQDISIILNENPVMPFAKFDMLCSFEPLFRASWDRSRKVGDSSPSEYDLSLASFAAKAGWSNQEIADLLILARKKHGDGLKYLGYFQRTIARGRLRTENNKKARELMNEQALEESQPGQKSSSSSDDKLDPLEELSQLLGVKIIKITQVMDDERHFRLYIDKDGKPSSISLGKAAGINNATAFRNSLADLARVSIPRFKPAIWDKIAAKILDVCIDEEPDPLETPGGWASHWIKRYLAAYKPQVDPGKSLAHDLPFLDMENQTVYITLPDLKRFCETYKEGIKGWSNALKSAGCEPCRKSVQIGGRWSTKYAWAVPKDLTP